MKMYVAFPYADRKEGYWLEVVVGWVTKSNLGHVDLWFQRDDGVIMRATAVLKGGVVFTNIGPSGAPIIYDESLYEIHPLPDDFPYQKVLDWLLGQGEFVDKGPEIGCPYDINGVLRFVFPCTKPSARAWFCSELVAKMLSLYEKFTCLGVRPYLFSPALLRDKLIELLGESRAA